MSERTPPSVYQLRRWRCHSVVRAVKIVHIDLDPEKVVLQLTELPFSIVVSVGWARCHSPEPGGYYVVHADGYASYMPAREFEANHSALKVCYRYRSLAVINNLIEEARDLGQTKLVDALQLALKTLPSPT